MGTLNPECIFAPWIRPVLKGIQFIEGNICALDRIVTIAIFADYL